MAITTTGRGPEQLPRADLDLFRQQVLALGEDLTVQQQFGQRLNDLYRKALQK